MAVNEFIKKFSNEIYATKNDVIREMKTPLVDGIWSQVIEYRKAFYETLTLTNYDSTRFSVCLTPNISKKINNFERKLISILNKYSKLQRNFANEYFKNKTYKKILRYIARKYKIDIQDTVLDGIIDGTITFNLPADQTIIQRYYSCLQDIEENYLQDIDENTLGNFYSKLMGTDDLTEYYRKTDTNKYNGYSIGRLKIGVAPQNIENSVNQLIRFINYDNQSLIVKAVSTFYYIYYIRPFENYSEEIALLMLKKVLAYNDISSVAALLSFEALLENKDELEGKIADCQKYYDLTYLINYVLDKIEPLTDRIADDIVESQNVTIKKELYQADPEPIPEQKEPIFESGAQTTAIPTIEKTFIEKEPLTSEELRGEPIQESVFEPIHEEKVQEVTQEPAEEKEETVAPVVEEVQEHVETIEEPKQEEKDISVGRTEEEIKAYEDLVKPVQPTLNGSEKVNFAQNIAISNVPTGLTEDEATRLEEHLMEMNPNLSHGQAYFYARHCTIGMYYTVDQYKKCVGCAYETARSSMNNLVLLGYYKKELLKKKFVYLPVKRN